MTIVLVGRAVLCPPNGVGRTGGGASRTCGTRPTNSVRRHLSGSTQRTADCKNPLSVRVAPDPPNHPASGTCETALRRGARRPDRNSKRRRSVGAGLRPAAFLGGFWFIKTRSQVGRSVPARRMVSGLRIAARSPVPHFTRDETRPTLLYAFAGLVFGWSSSLVRG